MIIYLTMSRKNINNDIKDIRREELKNKKQNRKKSKLQKHNAKKKVPFSFWIAVIAIGISLVIFREALHPYFQSMLFSFENFLSNYETIFSIYLHIKNAILSQSILGIGYIMFIFSLFFIPAPIEAIFIGFLFLPINPLHVLAISSIAGTLGHYVNYLIGWLFGKQILKKSKNNNSKMLEWLNRSGGLLLFLFNYFPLPSQPASIIYGFIRYSTKKFLIITFIARSLKFATLIVLFEYARPLLDNIPFL